MLTAFYTFRAYFMTFCGPERFPEEAGHHPHEATPIMAWPLRILAVAALLIGLAVGPTHLFGDYLQKTVGLTPTEAHFHFDVMALSVVLATAGIGLAWMLYVAMPRVPGAIARMLKPFYVLSLNKLFLDEIFYGIVVLPLKGTAWLSTVIDRRLIDGLIDGVGRLPLRISNLLKGTQAGPATSYAGIMLVGAVAAVMIVLSLL
jgi:NADH-quinone oxidoreductase subunit L